KETVSVPLNFELACTDEIVAFACKIKPHQATLVPERREEITTEGGLDISSGKSRFQTAIQKLRDAGIVVSLFLDPDLKQIELAKELGADAIELHTGTYAHAFANGNASQALETLKKAAKQIVELEMTLH